MFISYLFYVLIFNLNIIKSLQTEKLNIKSIYPSLTTFETTTDYKKRLRKLIRKHALPFKMFTKKNQVTNAPARKLKLPYYLPLLKTKNIINTRTNLPYSSNTKNVTTKPNLATVKSIPSKIPHYPTKMTFIPRTITYTHQVNPYFKLPISSEKYTEFNDKNVKNVIDNAKYSNKHIVIPKHSLAVVRIKSSTKGAAEQKIEEALKFRRKLSDEVIHDVLSDEVIPEHNVDPDYTASSSTVYNRTYHNYNAFFNTDPNLRAKVYYHRPSKVNHRIANSYLTESTEDLPKYEYRKTFHTVHPTKTTYIDLEKFKISIETAGPTEAQLIYVVDDLLKTSNPEVIEHEYPTETTKYVTDGVPLVYKAIDKEIQLERQKELMPEVKLLYIHNKDNVPTGTSQIIPTRTTSIIVSSRPFQIVPTRISQIIPTRTTGIVPSTPFQILPTRTSQVVPSRISQVVSSRTSQIVTTRTPLIVVTRTPLLVLSRTSHNVPARTLKNAFLLESTDSSKTYLWRAFSTAKTQAAWRVRPPENPNPTRRMFESTTTSEKRKWRKKKPKKITNVREAYITQWPMQTGGAFDRKNPQEIILVTNYQTSEKPTINNAVIDLLRRLNYKKPTTIPTYMRRDWANWGYRRGKTGDPRIYLDLYNNFYDMSYVTR